MLICGIPCPDKGFSPVYIVVSKRISGGGVYENRILFCGTFHLLLRIEISNSPKMRDYIMK